MEGIVTADFGVSETPALLIGFHEGGLLVRKDMADDHGGASNERCLKEQGERPSYHRSACIHTTNKVRHSAQDALGTITGMVRARRSKAGEARWTMILRTVGPANKAASSSRRVLARSFGKRT